MKLKQLTKFLVSKFNEYFPKKKIKISNDDQPWITKKLKDLDRQRKRVYHKQRRSDKFKKLDKTFKKEVKAAKDNFHKSMVSDLEQKNPNQWYSVVKRMSSYENKSEEIMVEEINHLTNQEHCDLIADEFEKVPNHYSPLQA